MRRTMLILGLLVPILSGGASLAAQGSPLTLEALFHPARKVAFVEPLPCAWSWRPDGTLLEDRSEHGVRTELATLAPPAWTPRVLLTHGQFLAALADAGGTDAGDAEAAWRGTFTWNGRGDAFLTAAGSDLYLVDPAKPSVRRLTDSPVAKEAPAFSPDGSKVAFLEGSDLAVVDLATGRQIRLSSGDADHLNGRLDWVYQEELYQRQGPGAFWWSPDSSRIAFLSLDESQVPRFTLVNELGRGQVLTSYPYPRPGDPLPVPRLTVAALDGTLTRLEDPYQGQDVLVVAVGWDPDGNLVANYQDRAQTWLECLRFQDGKGRLLVRESARPGWVDRLPVPLFLPDGGFLWRSARTGFRHLYRYGPQGGSPAAVTAGAWNVDAVQVVDWKKGKVYFTADQRNPIGVDAYSADLAGPGPNARLARLTESPGTHQVSWSPDFTTLVDRWSDYDTPPRLLLSNDEGQLLRRVDSPTAPEFRALRPQRRSFQQVPTRDGVPMETLLVLPPDFQPSRRYPVLHVVYGGPGLPLVRNAFSPVGLWYRFLAEQGIVTWICDNRSASGRGPGPGQGVRGRLGVQELQDQLDGLAWLKAQGWADPGRLALCGASYGGFLAAYAMTHANAWKAGILVAPVVDWMLYDGIYAERLMGQPADNPDGYRESAPLWATAHLSGKLLIVQGTLDPNVHFQQALQFLDAVQRDGGAVQLTLLPGAGHTPTQAWQLWAMYQALWDFLHTNL
jgi:dipeptidyl-peptidase-4